MVLDKVLRNVPHRQWVFTIPRVLRKLFYKDRRRGKLGQAFIQPVLPGIDRHLEIHAQLMAPKLRTAGLSPAVLAAGIHGGSIRSLSSRLIAPVTGSLMPTDP